MYALATDFWMQLVESEEIIPFVAIVVGALIAGFWIAFGTVRSIMVTREREATKREIAAYVAEGSMDPKQAVALIKAGPGTGDEDGEEA